MFAKEVLVNLVPRSDLFDQNLLNANCVLFTDDELKSLQ